MGWAEQHYPFSGKWGKAHGLALLPNEPLLLLRDPLLTPLLTPLSGSLGVGGWEQKFDLDFSRPKIDSYPPFPPFEPAWGGRGGGEDN